MFGFQVGTDLKERLVGMDQFQFEVEVTLMIQFAEARGGHQVEKLMAIGNRVEV